MFKDPPPVEMPPRAIGQLALRTGTARLLAPAETVARAMELFDEEPGLPGIVVVDRTAAGERFVALLSRIWLQTILARAFARELYLHSPIERLLSNWRPGSLLVEANVTIEDAVTQALSRPEAEHFEPLVVHGEDGQFRVIELRAALLSQRDTLVHLAHELEAAKAAAETASRAKGSFLANLSHEIRTPMNAILGMTELLQDMATSPRQREYQAIVKQSAEGLLRLLNDVLDLSKLEAGKVRLEEIEFSPRDVLIDALRPLSLRAAEKKLELACRFDPRLPETLRGDPGRLGQVVTNLVGNAIKFTGVGEVVVSVEVIALALDRARILVAVRDTGIGIPADRQDAIFEAFSQADNSTTRRFGGTGLGLTISTQLVGLMDGKLRVESAPGKGSIFRFTVTIDAPFRRPSPSPPGALAGLRALVADDNAACREIVAEALSWWKMRPETAASAGGALDLARRAANLGEPFRVAVLDAAMPEVDVTELAKLLAEAGIPQGRVVLLVTPGKADTSEAAFERVYKPVRPLDLLRAVTRAMALPTTDGAPAKREAPPAVSRPLRILLAEDGPVNQQVAIALLERRGHRATVAANGKEAIAALERERFDVILMDVQMPEMDGLEATRILRSRTDLPRTPIIAMTANAMAGDREQCLAVGMDGYVAKPVRPDELYAAVESLARPPEPLVAAETPRAMTREPFDRGAALELAGGSEELLRDLAAAFCGHASRVRSEMEAAFAAKSALKVERAAHALKGSSSVLAARPVAEAALALERVARDGDLEAATGWWTKLALELDLLLPMLEDLAAEAALAPGKSHRNEAINGAF